MDRCRHCRGTGTLAEYVRAGYEDGRPCEDMVAEWECDWCDGTGSDPHDDDGPDPRDDDAPSEVVT